MKYKFLMGVFLLGSQWAFPSTFTVTNTNDEGDGSLRAAVSQANAERGMSRIEFSLPAGDQTISLKSSLTISSSVEIEGSEGIVLENTEESCILLCDGVASGDTILLRNIGIGSSVLQSNREHAQIELRGVAGDVGAVFVCEGVKMDSSTFLTRSSGMAHVQAYEYPWAIKMVDCRMSDGFYGIVYGKSLELRNMFISSGRTLLSTLQEYVAESVVIDHCVFSHIDGYTYLSGRKTRLNELDSRSSRTLVLACATNSDIEITNCTFAACQDMAIRTSNSMDGWNVKMEGCQFYDMENIAFPVVALTKSYVEGESYAPSEVLVSGNYFGVAPNGEAIPIAKGLSVDAEKVTIKDNVFGNILDSVAIYDCGSDDLLVENNYFGTDAEGNDQGACGIRICSIDGELMEMFYPEGRKQNKRIVGNTFAQKGAFGVKVDTLSVKATIFDNLFLGSEPGGKAIWYTAENHGMDAPEFSAKASDGSIQVAGTGIPGSTVQLYKCGQTPQSAFAFLDSVKVGEDGSFSANLPLASIGEEQGDNQGLYLSATMTVHDTGGSATTELSDPVYVAMSTGAQPLLSDRSNPVTVVTEGFLPIVNAGLAVKTEVVDAWGRRFNLPVSETLDVHALPMGVYMLFVDYQEETSSYRFVKR
ncbi:MAG: hypothetical protein IKX43_00330 [Paludibacteraceae bacterium]|nr:hypothetical protein [Paludibacteraceae bacterium]